MSRETADEYAAVVHLGRVLGPALEMLFAELFGLAERDVKWVLGMQICHGNVESSSPLTVLADGPTVFSCAGLLHNHRHQHDHHHQVREVRHRLSHSMRNGLTKKIRLVVKCEIYDNEGLMTDIK